jgi:predicted phage tail protein
VTPDEIRALLKYSGPATWRTTVVGALLLAFAAARVWLHPEAILDGGTATLVAAGCALILGSDKLLGK